MKYAEKLRDPRWQRKRLEIFQRDNWKCTECGNDQITLHVHHEEYTGEPWEAPGEKLRTVCEICHLKLSTSKIDQIINFIQALGLKCNAIPILGKSDLCFEEYLIDVSGFGKQWKDISDDLSRDISQLDKLLLKRNKELVLTR